MQGMQQSLFDSQAHVVQGRRFCTKYETFRFFLPAGNLRDCLFKSAYALTWFCSNSGSQRDAHECMN